MLASAVFRMTRPPYVIGGAAMMWGYLKSWFQRVPQFEDKSLSEFIRKYQWTCLLKGKKRATDELNATQKIIWEKSH
jgi:hypothetical protein